MRDYVAMCLTLSRHWLADAVIGGPDAVQGSVQDAVQGGAWASSLIHPPRVAAWAGSLINPPRVGARAGSLISLPRMGARARQHVAGERRAQWQVLFKASSWSVTNTSLGQVLLCVRQLAAAR